MFYAFECYYCNDEQGYYCPQPFPLKSMFKNNYEYYEQIKNIAVSSSGDPLIEPIVSCFVRKIMSSNLFLCLFIYRFIDFIIEDELL